MKNINIKNDCLDIIISTLGAEMISIVTNQTQRLHQSEPVWENCAPVLFPFCGRTRDGKYTADGREYPMKIHGFAMDREFEVVCHEADRAVFKLSSDDKTRAVYPYDFEFYVAYEINNNAIDVKYRVVNTGNKEMYFALGSHEGYICPEGLDEYEIHFEKNESAVPLIRRKPVVPAENLGMSDGHSVLRLSNALFEDSITVVYPDIESRYVYLVHRSSGKKVKVEFEDFNNLMIWCVPFRGYICIEPWTRMADASDAPYELKEKPGIIAIESGKEYANHHVITLY